MGQELSFFNSQSSNSLSPITPPLSMTKSTTVLQDNRKARYTGNLSDFSQESQFQIFSHCPHKKTVFIYMPDPFPRAVLKMSRTWSYHMKDPDLRMSPGGDTVEDAGTSRFFFFLPTIHLLFAVYNLPLFAWAGIWVLYIILELKQVCLSRLSDSTDIKTDACNPPAHVDHRYPVVCLHHIT